MARIMVVDDDPLLRNLCLKLVSLAGHEGIEASGGQEAIDLFRTQACDLVFMDILMPKFDGSETIVSLLHEFPHARIVAMSGGFLRQKDVFLQDALRNGAIATIAKPFTGEEFLSLVERLLKGGAPAPNADLGTSPCKAPGFSGLDEEEAW